MKRYKYAVTDKYSVAFCGPLAHLSFGSALSGGQRRLTELYNTAKSMGFNVSIVTYSSDLLCAVRSARGRYAVAVVFNERYLALALPLRLFGYSIIFCPRGNKLVHHRYHHSALRLSVYRKIFNILYSICTRIVFQTHAQVAEFQHEFQLNKPVEVVPNNVNATWMKRLTVREDFPQRPYMQRIGFLGGDNPRKGYGLLQEAVTQVRRAGLNITLAAAGYFTEAPVCDGIEHIGVIKDLRHFYSSVDVVIVPSEYDSFPNVFLEALAARTPVLLSATPITREICRGLESILFERKPKALAERLFMLYYEPSSFSTLVEDCALARKKYNFCWGESMMNAIIGRKFDY